MFMTTSFNNINFIAVVINVSAGFQITVVTLVTRITGICIFTKFLFDHYLLMHKRCSRRAGENWCYK